MNIVPKTCVLEFEIRSLAAEDTGALIARLQAAAAAIVAPYLAAFPEAAIEVERLWDYPGLGTSVDADVVGFAKGLVGGNSTIKVPYGTEGGMFAARLGVPTVICGSGRKVIPSRMRASFKAFVFERRNRTGRPAESAAWCWQSRYHPHHEIRHSRNSSVRPLIHRDTR